MKATTLREKRGQKQESTEESEKAKIIQQNELKEEKVQAPQETEECDFFRFLHFPQAYSFSSFSLPIPFQTIRNYELILTERTHQSTKC